MTFEENKGHVSAEITRDLTREILRVCGRVHLRAQGWSMFPTLRRGDTLIVEPVRLQEIRIGDVVVMVQGSKLACHRFVSSGRDADGALLITRGDTCLVDDLPARETDLLGRVARVIRKRNILPVASTLNPIDGMAAAIFRHGFPALRAFMQVRPRLPNGRRTIPKESTAQC